MDMPAMGEMKTKDAPIGRAMPLRAKPGYRWSLLLVVYFLGVLGIIGSGGDFTSTSVVDEEEPWEGDQVQCKQES